MNATSSVVDLDDVDGLIDSDRGGLLRAAAASGAHVRATAAAVDEGALESVAGELPRTIVWVAGPGSAETAGNMLAAMLSDAARAPIVVAANVPAWIGALDVLVVAGDDPADPNLAEAASLATRRGSRVVVVAPFEGPLRDAAAARAAVLEPRLPVEDSFGLCRYLAAGLATVAAVDGGVRTDLGALADELDAEALRSSATRELFTNPAKALADRMLCRQVVLAADSAATLALARHGSAVMLRVAGEAVVAAALTDVLAALHSGIRGQQGDSTDALFHDEQIDGPRAEGLRVLALVLNADRPVVAARVGEFADVELVGAKDISDPVAAGRIGSSDQQLGVLAVRLEMAAAYLRLVRG